MREAAVKLPTGEQYQVTGISGFDYAKDLALITIEAVNGLSVPFGNSDAVAAGDAVVVIGSPAGFDGSLSSGVVSAVRIDVEGHRVFQATAPISSGSSGGGMFNMCGELIGITTSSMTNSQNLNFFVASKHVEELLAGRTGRTWTLADFSTEIAPEVENTEMSDIFSRAQRGDAAAQFDLGHRFYRTLP